MTTTAQTLLSELTGVPVDRWPTHWAGNALTRDAIALEHRLIAMAAAAGITVTQLLADVEAVSR